MPTFRELVDRIPSEKRRLGSYLSDLLVSIEEIMKEKEITQKALAERLDMEPPQLSRLLSDIRNYQANPTLATIARISTALDTELLGFPVFEEWSRNTFGDSRSTTLTDVSGVVGDRTTYVDISFGDRGAARITVLTGQAVLNSDAEGRVTIQRAAA